MATKLHWIDGPWLGRLAMSARPRGGDWIADEVAQWHRDGIDTVVSLLEPFEAHDLDLSEEGPEVRMNGMKFRSLPIVDRDVPSSAQKFAEALEELNQELQSGRNIVLHCRQGVGRTGLVAACLLTMQGFEPAKAVELLTLSRGIEVPETAEQRLWLDKYTEMFAAAR